MADKAQFGMIGMAVMGRNLALNVLDHGFRVSVFNREPDLLERANKEAGNRWVCSTSNLKEFVQSLERPRTIMMLIRAGQPVDMVMEQLKPLLDENDIVIDGGNTLYTDTQRREKDYAAAGLRFFGVGVSGGEDGARNGPSLMPGGDRDAYQNTIRPIFEAIAAKTDSGACVTHCGPDGAGHFVKMVHNGIEYADMQFIAEACDVLARIGGMNAGEIGDVFDEWNRGLLEAFLTEVTAKVLKVKDPKTNGWLVDSVLDQAGQKGTGKWTVIVALELGIPVPSIAASVDARVLSSMKRERVAASKILPGPAPEGFSGSKTDFVRKVHDALYAAKIVAYAQGMHLLDAASGKLGWDMNLKELARIWKGGCIIRARFLDSIMKAYERRRDLPNLLLDEEFRNAVTARQGAWREIVALAAENGIPVPGMSSGLAYYDSYRSAELPQNITQAQRDAFGSHTYQRKDDPDGPFIHTEWLKTS
jgi:6-phosphogluconate dehydrogenase